MLLGRDLPALRHHRGGRADDGCQRRSEVVRDGRQQGISHAFSFGLDGGLPAAEVCVEAVQGQRCLIGQRLQQMHVFGGLALRREMSDLQLAQGTTGGLQVEAAGVAGGWQGQGTGRCGRQTFDQQHLARRTHPTRDRKLQRAHDFLAGPGGGQTLRQKAHRLRTISHRQGLHRGFARSRRQAADREPHAQGNGEREEVLRIGRLERPAWCHKDPVEDEDGPQQGGDRRQQVTFERHVEHAHQVDQDQIDGMQTTGNQLTQRRAQQQGSERQTPVRPRPAPHRRNAGRGPPGQLEPALRGVLRHQHMHLHTGQTAAQQPGEVAQLHPEARPLNRPCCNIPQKHVGHFCGLGLLGDLRDQVLPGVDAGTRMHHLGALALRQRERLLQIQPQGRCGLPPRRSVQMQHPPGTTGLPQGPVGLPHQLQGLPVRHHAHQQRRCRHGPAARCATASSQQPRRNRSRRTGFMRGFRKRSSNA